VLILPSRRSGGPVEWSLVAGRHAQRYLYGVHASALPKAYAASCDLEMPDSRP
jgi:hypothetical protein